MRKLITFILVLLPFFTTSVTAAPVHKNQINKKIVVTKSLDKKATAEQYGDEQVHIWRRSYDISPPDLDPQDPNSAHNDRRYANIPSDVVPNAENLKITLERALPFWEDQIAPAMLSGKRVLVVAHGNSLRALAKHIIGISDAEIMDFEIPTGQPLVLKLDDKLNYVEHYYL